MTREISWEELEKRTKNVDTLENIKKSKFPHGSTQHFVDAVFVVFGGDIMEDVKYHVEKYGHRGGLEVWQIDLMITELEDEIDAYGFGSFVVGYFGGSVQNLEFHNV